MAQTVANSGSRMDRQLIRALLAICFGTILEWVRCTQALIAARFCAVFLLPHHLILAPTFLLRDLDCTT